jgi:putative restriction endonuclease
MKTYVAVTDRRWFEFLRAQPDLEEVNFWQPGGNQQFRVLQPGELFLFKLHYPNNYIVGGGYFAHSTIVPISLAWEAFELANGSSDFLDFRQRVAAYKHLDPSTVEDFKIGCILLEQPFFLPENLWIKTPSDWNPNIVQGKTYDLEVEPGLSLWYQLQIATPSPFVVNELHPRYGEPVLVKPRLGQGSFRMMVTDAYNRKCAITKERTLPALDAAHIIPYNKSGLHVVNNGILLRRDLHALFDQGYITVTPDKQVEVSRKIREEYENGRDYYSHHGQSINLPGNLTMYPSVEYLEWHNINVYKG